MRIAIFSTLFLSTLTLANPSLAENSAPAWEYTGEKGADYWGKLDPSFHLCEEGRVQSPIDIKSTMQADLPSIKFTYPAFAPEIVHNGHTIQVNVPQGGSMFVGKEIFTLLQFHFHTPSEYHMNGKSYPMEVHFVHKRDDGVLGVLGVMFEEGEANKELAKLWSNLPKKAGGKILARDTAVDITKLLPARQTYYHFMGSLTTPPCSEEVKWYVMTDTVTASREQIMAFRKLFPMNARPLQPTNNRMVIRDQQ